MRTQFIVIGMPDNQCYISKNKEILDIINSNTHFSGGKRHYELLRPFLPVDAVWIDIKVPLADVFDEYEYHRKIVVFASGDPLFSGFASTILKRMPEAEVTIMPSFNSLQMLSHELKMSYEDMLMVPLTGRPWHELDRALIENRMKIGILTDHVHTPAAIAMRLLKYGFTQYKMYIGEHLGNPGEAACIAFTRPVGSGRAFDRKPELRYPATDVQRYHLPAAGNTRQDVRTSRRQGTDDHQSACPRARYECTDVADVQPLLGYRFLYRFHIHRSQTAISAPVYPCLRDTQGMLETDGREQLPPGRSRHRRTYR